MSQIDKQAIITEYKRHDADSGSSEVQVAILSKKITHLTEHLKINKKDQSSRFGLIKMVNKRRKLLDYLKRTDNAKYQNLLKELNIRR